MPPGKAAGGPKDVYSDIGASAGQNRGPEVPSRANPYSAAPPDQGRRRQEEQEAVERGAREHLAARAPESLDHGTGRGLTTSSIEAVRKGEEGPGARRSEDDREQVLFSRPRRVDETSSEQTSPEKRARSSSSEPNVLWERRTQGAAKQPQDEATPPVRPGTVSPSQEDIRDSRREPMPHEARPLRPESPEDETLRTRRGNRGREQDERPQFPSEIRRGAPSGTRPETVTRPTSEGGRSARLRAAREEARWNNSRPAERQGKGPLDSLPGESSGQQDSLEKLGRHYLYGAPVTPSEQRMSLARKVSEANEIDKRHAKREAADPSDRVAWSRTRGFGRAMDKEGDAEILTREERVVHSELLRVVPMEAKLSEVRIADDTSRVQARVAVRNSNDAARWQRACRDFENRTGRVLDLEFVKEHEGIKTAPGTDQTPLSTSKARTHRDDTLQETTPRDKGEPQPEPSRINADLATNTDKVAQETRVPLQIVGANKTLSQDVATADLQTLISVQRTGLKIGVPGPNRFERTYLIVSQSQSGSGGSRMAGRRFRRPEKDDEGSRTSQSKDNSGTGSTKDPRAEDLIAVRAHDPREAQERSDQERERGQGHRQSGPSNCQTCGTLLPEAQANACPVCAQSGPDVMAMASIHYRSAGAKFLATVDLFTATEDARDLIMTGAAPTVVALRYEQDIPGHKDFLRFKVKP